jgi:hypothetical protein
MKTASLLKIFSLVPGVKNSSRLALMAHTCYPSCSGVGDQEDCSSRPAQAKNLKYFISPNKAGHGGLSSQVHK